MTFEEFMAARFPHFDLAKGEMVVNGVWLKGLWLAAQQHKSRWPRPFTRPRRPFASEAPQVRDQSGHCWHSTRPLPFLFRPRQRCCWCGRVRVARIAWSPWPGHGPHVQTRVELWSSGSCGGGGSCPGRLERR
jgi:hypothetical protein